MFLNNRKSIVEQVKKIKYLGNMIDDKLTFREHANFIINKVAKIIGVLNRIRKYISAYTASLVYKSIILPHFMYCPTVLYMFCKADIESMQKLQNKAMRIILKCNRYTRIKEMLDAYK